MTPDTKEVVKAALVAFDQLQGQDLHQLARSAPRYSLREHDEDFVNDIALWHSAIENADPRALRLVILLIAQHGDGKGTQPVACAILRASELHAAEDLVLEALRDLIYYHDPVIFRSLLPFLVRSWDKGWVSFEASAPANRAEIVAWSVLQVRAVGQWRPRRDFLSPLRCREEPRGGAHHSGEEGPARGKAGWRQAQAQVCGKRSGGGA